MSEGRWTPATENVRAHYNNSRRLHGAPHDQAAAEFDRWLIAATTVEMGMTVQGVSDAAEAIRENALTRLRSANTPAERAHVIDELSAASFKLGRRYQRNSNTVELRAAVSTSTSKDES